MIQNQGEMKLQHNHIKNKIMDFKKTLLEELDLQDIPDEKKKELLEKTADVVFGNVLLQLLNELNDEEAKELNRLLEAEKQDEAGHFLYNKFPNLDQMFDAEIKRIKEKLINEK